jgi:hypothetical protein
MCTTPPKPVYDRTPSLMDLDAYVQLIKDTIKNEINPVQFPLLWRGLAHEDFMENYQDFFAAAAATGLLLSSTVLKKALKKQFAGDPVCLEEFADKLCKTHSKCKHGAKNVVTGEKTTEVVNRITKIWKRNSSSINSSSTLSSGASHVVEIDKKDMFDNETEAEAEAEDDENPYQRSKTTLADTIALFKTSSSSSSSKTSKSLKRTISIASSCCSEVEASAACAEAKKQSLDGAVKVV